MKERASELKDMFDCLIELENATNEIDDILQPLHHMPKLHNLQQAEEELSKVEVGIRHLNH